MVTTRRVLALVCALAGVPSLAAEGAPGSDALLPFLRADDILSARMSPGGTTVAIVTKVGKRQLLGLIDLASRKMVRVELSGEMSVGAIHWAGNGRLVMQQLQEAAPGEAGLQDYGELAAVNADGSGGRLVYGFRAGTGSNASHFRHAESEGGWAYVLSRLRADPDHVLIATQSWEDVSDPAVTVYRLNARDGTRDLVTRAPLPGAGFLTDEDGQVRIAWARDRKLGNHFFYREAKGTWEPLSKAVKGLGPRTEPLGISAAERLVYLLERDDAGFVVLAQSLDSGERKELARNAIAPPSDLVYDPQHRVVAVEFTPDLPDYTFVLPDHPLARVLKGLAATFAEEYVRLVNATDDGKKVLVKVFSDRDPGRYLVVDSGSLTADLIGQARPWVKPEDSAEVSAFHIRASDGFRLHGYVTLPRGAGGAPPPMVVMPHGGPFGARDEWEYDSESQLLASQGFAVLRVNYRGSGGYGALYEEAGYGHWGDRMIDDLVDATRFAMGKRWADPRRICIYGASYGGFAALQAAARSPGLFRCAVGYAGVYDLERLANLAAWFDTPLGRGHVDTQIGTDPEALRAASPALHADRIKVPVLLIHGEKDERAPLDQAERMRKALTAAGRPPEWLVEPAEGHGFVDGAAQLRMYTRLLAFLRTHTAPAPKADPEATPAAP